jgi:uncharacterized C2H2 Zn-finger protein
MGNAARKARKRDGEKLMKTPKVGTPLEKRQIKPVYENDGRVHPSARQYTKVRKQIAIRDAGKRHD